MKVIYSWSANIEYPTVKIKAIGTIDKKLKNFIFVSLFPVSLLLIYS